MTPRILASSALVTSLLLSGCFIELDGELGGSIRGTIDAACWADGRPRSERTEISETITEVIVDGGVGDIRVQTHAEAGAVVDAEVFGDRSEPLVRLEGSVLHVGVDCGGADCCAGDLDLTIPVEASLVLDLGVGDVSVDGLAGPARIDVGTGDVEMHGLANTFEASVSTGSIEGRGLASTHAFADVGTGDVDLGWQPSAVLEDVHVDIGLGSAELEVPAGEYALHLDVGLGDIDTDGLRGSAGASGSISVDVGTGDIDIVGR